MAEFYLSFSQRLDMVFHAAENRVIIFVHVKNVHKAG
jgi:hypothetical protein